MTQKQSIQFMRKKEHFTFADLLEITEILRGEDGCPWDREQTHESVRRCMIEEAYEVAEAIDKKDTTLLCEELGDALFQVVFHAELEREENRFSMDDVIDGICKKMIRRHPHVFGEENAKDGEDALARWEEIKSQEKQRKTTYERLSSIPAILPALLRAQKVHEKMGESSKNQAQTLLQNAEEYIRSPGNETLGALLFEISRTAACQNLNAEFALSQAVDQFILGKK